MISPLKVRGVVVTASSDADGVDFVSRWFGAAAGVKEDPVTGSAHSQIAPYWAATLGRGSLVGRQLSARGGTVHCDVRGDRVHLSGAYPAVPQGHRRVLALAEDLRIQCLDLLGGGRDRVVAG